MSTLLGLSSSLAPTTAAAVTGVVAFLVSAALFKVAVLCWARVSGKAVASFDTAAPAATGAVAATAGATAGTPPGLPVRERGLLIGIEGNISSGKSTVCARLQNGVCGATGQVTRVMFEQISPLLLKLFYGAASRYAFTLQLTTLQKRIDNIWRMRASCDAEGSIGLLDRSTMGDLVFATKQYLDANIDESETAVYVEEWVRSVLHAGYFVDQVLYLHSTPELCRSRVAQRGNVDKDVKHDYLNDIDNLHVYGLWWLMTAYPNAKPCFIADWRRFGQAGDLLSSVFRRDPCVLQWDTASSPTAASAGAAASPSAKETARTVSRLEAKDLEYYSENLQAVKELHATVMIPYDSHLQPLADGVLPRLLPAYRFVHSQAFKNCVMSCLSEGKRVVFYLSRPHEARPTCMLDFFASLPNRLATVESLAPVHAQITAAGAVVHSPTSAAAAAAANSSTTAATATATATATASGSERKEKRSGPGSPERVHCPESPASHDTVRVKRTSPERNTDSPTRRKLSVSVEDKGKDV